MARLALNKASLTKLQRQLKTYKDVLPSLDLKRRQLLAEQARARRRLMDVRQQLGELDPLIASELLMLSTQEVDLTDIVKVVGVQIVEENVVGTRLPKLEKVDIEVRQYAFLGRPHWVERVVDALTTAVELRLQLQVAEQRQVLLNQAARKITQRVNLFDKVLIPRAQANIKKIQIYLSDAARAAVVNSKIAKRKKGVAA
ncbi:V-type ATP synthase subunit D [Leptolyngbyaceae cyanobacterium CCMR0082]|uniref:V-type ATP synthase subunit D n=2 Tax=Adonisia turfae TaxID=2950184 RepID=A0A6M0SGY4_9CYAN|nr:V-type ATP synthase subunit D [Adonisia turfae]MDV3353740.1 V-type ATP synthase subunit D [Leptothoe sp. LEGE 181152]NEZ60993.1 V-type ATP synthase subunit D [Adonisia turfae CCMR0081]NEZ67243.1 V-type ATP synthase subunit D [Adonisia turfae CCMR0082]